MGEGRFVQLVAITSNNEQNIALVLTLHCNGIMSSNPAFIALCYTLIEPKPYNALKHGRDSAWAMPLASSLRLRHARVGERAERDEEGVAVVERLGGRQLSPL